ncbi:hypothetical protein COCNU_09G005110 [Cocos nucifera]|uniref:DUF241 domain protein n=1 Tax=Cocos nucifera TaxID=13894 RepID=A0A8K0IJG4_COCNU|nr:hypothetical protein COCNU_09G005110 [Cocos nucifera]
MGSTGAQDSWCFPSSPEALVYKQEDSKDQGQSIILLSLVSSSDTTLKPQQKKKKKARMAAVVPDQCFHLRSISMPSRSHPLALQVEEELHELKTCVASSSLTSHMMGNALRGLGDLYSCIEELLHLPHNQQALSHLPQKRWLEEELDGSVRLLDSCGAARDSLVTVKEHIQDLQLALRRGGDAAIQSKMHAYIHFGKKAQKDLKNCLRSLKQTDNRSVSSSAVYMDSELLMVVRVLTEAKEINISLLKSVLCNLFMARSRPKASRWSFISKALQRKKVDCEEHENASDLEGLEVTIGDLETGLECLFRRLVQNRVSLLNILSL